MFKKDLLTPPQFQELEVSSAEKPIYRVAFKVNTDQVKAGDVLLLSFQMALANPFRKKSNSTPVHVYYTISDYDPTVDNRIECFTPVTATTIQPGAHQTIQASCNEPIDENANNKIFYFVVYAYSDKRIRGLKLQVLGAGTYQVTINLVRHTLPLELQMLQEVVTGLSAKVDELSTRLLQVESELTIVEVVGQSEISRIRNEEIEQGKHIAEVQQEIAQLEHAASAPVLTMFKRP